MRETRRPVSPTGTSLFITFKIEVTRERSSKKDQVCSVFSTNQRAASVVD